MKENNKIIDLAVERTSLSECNDDFALRDHWNKRRTRCLILSQDGRTFLSYEEMLRFMEAEQYGVINDPIFRRELINGPLRIRLGDRSLIRFEFPLERPNNFEIFESEFVEE